VLAEKAEARESRRCRVCAGKVHRGGTQSVVCPCDAFWVCPGCAKLMAAGLALAEHIKACAGRVDSDLDREKGSGDGGGDAADSE